jgi:hypothetical protein
MIATSVYATRCFFDSQGQDIFDRKSSLLEATLFSRSTDLLGFLVKKKRLKTIAVFRQP